MSVPNPFTCGTRSMCRPSGTAELVCQLSGARRPSARVVLTLRAKVVWCAFVNSHGLIRLGREGRYVPGPVSFPGLGYRRD